MKMTLRWFGENADSVKLWQIRQITGVTGVISTLYGVPAGEKWEYGDILEMKKTVEDAGLSVAGIESVNIHDSIKIGLYERDTHIESYIKTLENLVRADIRLVCYNFMPVFDWTRSDLAKRREDGSTVLAYDQGVVNRIDPEEMFARVDGSSGGFTMPGWEPERLKHTRELFEAYKNVDENRLFENLVYFLESIRPTCEKYGIKMAIHPDDPAWSVFGLPRIVNNKENISRLLKAVDSPFNGLTLCTGSLGSDPNNDICDIIRSFGERIYFAHIRNLRHCSPGKFEETAHLSSDGSMDMYEIMKALYDTGFDGPIRPDHGRAIWGENAMPGYGLYDRALGAAYLNGRWEAIEKSHLQSKYHRLS